MNREELKKELERITDEIEIMGCFANAPRGSGDHSLDEWRDNSIKAILNLFDQYSNSEYRRGYNANARDCYCGGSDIPHHHLLDDGESYNVRPNFAELEQNKESDDTN